MPLLLCPNCNTSMQSVARSGVELDMCPTCRGVWLDRGELEKILGAGREDAQTDVAARKRFDSEIDQFHRDPEAWRKSHPYDQERKRYKYDDDDYHHRKKKRFDIFDIFD